MGYVKKILFNIQGWIKRKGDYYMDNILQAKELVVKYEESKILNGMNIEAQKGELIYLVGENGCGKSTLFKTLTGRIEVEEGEIKIGGEIVYHEQKNILLKNMTVKENVESFNILFKNNMSKEKQNDLFEMFNLKDYLAKSVEKLSGGQKQRVSLIITLMRNKDIYLIDEADSAMDAKGRAIFFNMLNF